MSLLLPRMGVTECSRAISFLKNNPANVVGTFWVMCGYGFDPEPIPNWWIDIVLEENQAQAILDTRESGSYPTDHGDPLYLGFCIIVTADKSNPASISYIIQHLRMFEGEQLLKILAEYNIPAHTEVTYPSDFLCLRYGYGEDAIPPSLKDMNRWSTQLWEDYCSCLMAQHGQKMIRKYWSKSQ